MHIIKRNGTKENVSLDKVLKHIERFSPNTQTIDVDLIAQKIINGLCDGMKTSDLNNLAAEICAAMITVNSDYGILAARISISNLHKETNASFSETMKELFEYSILSESFYNIVMKYSKCFDSNIRSARDYHFSYFGFKTLEKSYLLKIKNKIVERPQYMLMRVAIEIHRENISKVLQTYNLMSKRYFIHASPTLFNAGTLKPQLSSCFLMNIKDKTTDGIFETIKQCAIISQHSGGIGLALHNIDNLIPLLRIINNTALYIEDGKRPSSFAVYLEPWHAEIFEFLKLKKNSGNENERARDLFYALWVPDLFMERVEKNKLWSLMSPSECPGLSDCWGENFNKLYERYEEEKKFKKQVSARTLWRAIIDSQIETGTPFILYKDTCNAKSNQKNLGTIQCSNLCTEIIQFSSKDEIAVCNLASIALNRFVNGKRFNFTKLKKVTKIITYNLNNIIDINFYPLKETQNSNLKHRPIGIGITGLADLFCILKYPFDSVEARKLNVKIFKTIYYAALEASCELARKDSPYDSFQNSPAANGILQFDLWNVTPSNFRRWSILKKKISTHGLRNSLVLTVMPTASTAQILGNNESIEAFTNNIYTRRVLSGEFQILNKYLQKDLVDNGLWNEAMRNKIIAHNGSIQDIKEIPDFMKMLYRTVWEIPQKNIIDMAIDRAPYIDQSQSLNIYMATPTFAKLSSMHFYAWKGGLKTGMYYLRSKSAAKPIQFTVQKECLSCSA